MKMKTASKARRGTFGALGLIFLVAIFLTGCNSSNFNAPAESIAATSGTPQSAMLNTPFASPLVATVNVGATGSFTAQATLTNPGSVTPGTPASIPSSRTCTCAGKT